MSLATSIPRTSAERNQARVAVTVLGAIALTIVVLNLLARNERLAAWSDERQLRVARETKASYSRFGYFIDFEDHLLLNEIPSADDSKGGVYLIGTSNLKYATKLWELPPDQRALIHNYGIGTSNHGTQLQFLQYLIEQEGLLRAGGDKTLVIFGLSYHDTAAHEPDGFFASLWGRHGLYSYTPDEGIRRASLFRIRRFLVVERQRIVGPMHQLRLLLKDSLLRVEHQARQHNPQAYNNLARGYMEPDWQEKIHDQISQFSRGLDYLRARNVQVMVVLLPQGGWEDNLPYSSSYNREISVVCKTKGIPLHDWSRMLEDDEFADSSHANLSGMEKLQQAFSELTIPFLHATGALP